MPDGMVMMRIGDARRAIAGHACRLGRVGRARAERRSPAHDRFDVRKG